MSDFKMYENYVFDLYGTLVDIHTEESNISVYKKLSLFYRFYGADYSAKELKDAYFSEVSTALSLKSAQDATYYVHEAYPEIELEEVFMKLFIKKGVNASEELAIHAGQFFRIESIRHLKLYPGVEKLLKAIKESGKRVYLLSNAQRIFTEYEMNALRISKYFDGILISSDEGYKKPDKRFFDLLETRYQVDFSKSIMIGNDSTSDIYGAMQAGMDTLYVRSNISPIHDPTPLATYVFENMNIKSIAGTLGFKI